MPNLSVVIGADTSRLVEEVKGARHMLNKFVDDTKNASNAAKNNASVTNEQVNAYKKVISSLEKATSGMMNSKQQQAALSASVKELKIQWANLSDTAKNGEFGKMLSSTLAESQSALSNLTTQIKQVDSEMGNMGGGNTRRQLMGLTKELTNLTAQYRAMSAVEKQSAQGQELAQKLSDLRTKAGALKDTVGDVQQEIKVLASDTPNLDVFNDVIGLSADALSTYSSIIAKVTGDEKALKDAIATVMTVQSAANLMTKVTNALQSSSAIMLKVRQVQELAAAAAIQVKTAAEGKSVVMTKAATVAQTAFNAVARMNPYVLLATAIIAAGAAIYGFVQMTNKSTEAEEQAQRQAEILKAKQEDLRKKTDELNETSAKTSTKFYELQTQWKNLKTEAEKKQWIENNKSAFSALGISVNSVSTAESIFTKNTDAVCQALLARAVAAKKAEQAANDLIKLDKQSQEKSTRTGDYYKKASVNDRISVEERKAAGVNTLGGLSQKSIDKINANRRKEAKKQRDERRKDLAKQKADIQKGYEESYKAQLEAEKKLASLGDTPQATSGKSGKSGGGNKGGSDTVKYAKESLSDLENQLSDLQSKYKDGLLPDMNADKYISEVKRLEKEIEDKKIELGIIVPALDGSIDKINEDIKKKQVELNAAITDESREKIQAEIDNLNRQKNEIEIKLKPVVKKQDLDNLEQEINDHKIEVNVEAKAAALSLGPKDAVSSAQSNADNLKKELDFNKQIVNSYKQQYDAIKEKQSLGGKLTADEQKLASIYDDTTKSVEKLSDAFDKASNNAKKLELDKAVKERTWDAFNTGVDTLGRLNGSISNVASTWSNLSERWEDMSGFEQVTAGFDAVISTIQNVIGAYQAISTMLETFAALKEAIAARNIAADQAETQSTVGKLGVQQAGSVANATEQGSKLPFPANIAAIAAGIAAVVAGFAMVFSCFADGGIVGGATTIGDYNIARVNKGEMILNGSQQKRLFNLLNADGNSSAIQDRKNNVVFTIKGQKLSGVLRNYNSKTKRI